MADNARYSIYDEKGNIIMTFVGKNDIIENAMKFGRLARGKFGWYCTWIPENAHLI